MIANNANGAPESNGKQQVTRRTIVQGAAWSVPVIALAAAAPASASASVPCVPGGPVNGTAPGTSAAGTSLPWTVPAGVRLITVVVVGGAGGSGPTGGIRLGGDGSSVTANIPVTPGEQLTLITGQGGSSLPVTNATTRFTLIEGGGGYGNGGSAQAVARVPGGSTRAATGGSGGGGSAILRGSTPLVVAGGGGSGNSLYTTPKPWTFTGLIGGNGNEDAPESNGTPQNGTVAQAKAEGGKAGASAGGAGGVTRSTTGTPTWDTKSGLNGGSWVVGTGALGNGGTGANAVSGSFPFTDNVNSGVVTSGAGGGGYTGGGSGALIASGDTDVTLHTLGAPGGGGANYTAPTVTFVSATSGGNARSDISRGPGSITITWTC